MESVDKNQKILEQLALLKEYALSIGNEKTTPVRINYIDQYIKVYSSPNPTITWKTFADLHDPKGDGNTEDGAVRAYKRLFGAFMNEYFEGRNEPVRLAYGKGYYLLLADNTKVVTSSDLEILYDGNKFLEKNYNPLIMKYIVIVCSLASILSLYLGVGLFWMAQSLWSLLLGMCLITVSFVTGGISISSLMVQEDRFSFLFYSDYFLRLTDEKVTIASYSGECPLCCGTVKLTLSLIRWRGYVGKCHKYPRRHVYSFDDSSLSGELLKLN